MNYKQFAQHIKDNGITLAKTTKDFRGIPKGTKLWFGLDGEVINTWNNFTDNKNKEFNYDFDYEWYNYWKNLYKGSFELVEELKGFAPDKNAKELGIDTSRKFVVLKENVSGFNKGEIITLREDDNTCNPSFWGKDKSHYFYCHWDALAYAPTEKKNKYLKIPGASYTGNTNIINKPNIIKKSMSFIQNAMKSKEDKALEYFNLGDTKDLNDAGRVEFTDFIFETGKTDRKEFLDYIVGLHKEKTK